MQILGPGDEVNKTVSWTSMSDCHWVRPTALDFMGYSMRTDTHRLVQWMRWDGDRLQPKWDQIVGLELYLLRSTIDCESTEMRAATASAQ
eukprot:COSAG02_NODE_2783_length_8036_cov_41.488976_6_plen_90_part_00